MALSHEHLRGIEGAEEALSGEQLRAIEIAERVGGCLSILGCIFIITTFFSSAAFRKPVRRLIFYASFGNIFSAVASLIGGGGISGGDDSFTCQFQAFLIQQ